MNRVQSLDVLKGLVMVLMVLDHVRMYFHFDAYLYDPFDLDETNVAVFFTRFVTHICAPVFVLLTGVSVYFVSRKMPSKMELTRWLVIRGLVMILIELTLINTGWYFTINTDLIILGVLWAIGIGLISLALLIHIPTKIVLPISLIIIVFHNLLDSFDDPWESIAGIAWFLLHLSDEITLGSITLNNSYPLIPTIAIVWLGYCMGPIFSWPAPKRIRLLGTTGIMLLVSFVLLRAFTEFGDFWPWEEYDTYTLTFLSFLDVHKSPSSLLYLMVTLGAAALILVTIELNGENWLTIKLKVFGKVPMFFYIIHIYVIHLLAMLFAAYEPNFSASDMVIREWMDEDPQLEGFGYSLSFVYWLWIGVVVLMYPISKKYGEYKLNNPQNKLTHYI